MNRTYEYAVKRWADAARTRAIQRAGSSRVTTAAWWPEIRDGLLRGYTVNDIAQGLNLSSRRIRDIKAYGLAQADANPIVPEPALVDKSLTEWTPDAFERFFIKYSGYERLLPHCRPWVEAFFEHPYLVLNVPPGHAKSTILSLWLPIWLICRDRNVQILLVSKANVLAKQWAYGIELALTTLPELVRDFGSFKPQGKGDTIPWRPASGELMVTGRTKESPGPQLTVQSRGSMQQILGMRADYIFCDDPTDNKVARSEEMRDAEWEWYTEQVVSRIQPGGHVAVIGQRVGMYDIYGRLGEQVFERGERAGQNVYHVETYPAVLDWHDEKVLWPEVWSFERLMERHGLSGSESFETMYQQNPQPEGGGLIKLEYMENCRVDREAWEGTKSKQNNNKFSRVLSIDPSPTRWHGLILGDLEYERTKFRFHVMGAWRVKAGELPVLTNEMVRIVRQYKPDYMVIEESTFSRWMNSDPVFIEISKHVKVLKHTTSGASKWHAEYGLQSLASDFEFANILLPCGNVEGRRMTDDLTQEALQYPEGLNDILMALWIVKFNWRKLRPVVQAESTARGEVYSYIIQARAEAERSAAKKLRRKRRELANA